MNLYSSDVNTRAINGNLPVDYIYPAEIVKFQKTDIEKKAQIGLEILKGSPDLLESLLRLFRNKCKEIDSIHLQEGYLQEVNFLINTSYDVETANNPGDAYRDAIELCPVVTEIDKILWYGSWAYCMESEALLNQYGSQDMMYTWIYLLQVLQEKEKAFNSTINVDMIFGRKSLIQVILGDWKTGMTGELVKLSQEEQKAINSLFDSRKKIVSMLRSEQNNSRRIALETQDDWVLFLSLINDLSTKEQSVITRINESISIREKKNIIYGYERILSDIESAKYELNGESINLLEVFEKVHKRLNTASSYCVACLQEGIKFRVHPALFMLAMNPKTYNYLFISFHMFRLSTNQDTAKVFFDSACKSIGNNLGMDYDSTGTLDQKIEFFYRTVSRFMDDNKDYLDQLTFNRIQEDGILQDKTFIESIKVDGVEADLNRRIINAKQKIIGEECTSEILIERYPLSVQKLEQAISMEENRSNKIEGEILAGQVIVSLNIIYMFCEAIRIALTNKHANIKITNKPGAQEIRKQLLSLEDLLVHKVYSSIDDKNMNMLEYREKIGLDTRTLSEQENQEERLRDSAIGEILKSSITDLIEQLDKNDVESILHAKMRIREEIRRFPECDAKYQFAEWIDTAAEKISRFLVQECKNKEDDYPSVKHTLIQKLGEKCCLLPGSTLDSLTTAEILFARYATENFAQNGFDFSCISALYYQAFEDAYNVLIWKPYAEMLNTLEIAGHTFVSILYDSNRGKITVHEAKGYLDDDGRQRVYYLCQGDKQKKVRYVNTRCMYKSFAILMENIKIDSELPYFCDFYAKRTGYVGRDEMFRDQCFMNKTQSFASTIKNSADNRNNASHGGSFVSITQCSLDKKTVLNDLEMVRENCVGLVQQLLYLMKG